MVAAIMPDRPMLGTIRTTSRSSIATGIVLAHRKSTRPLLFLAQPGLGLCLLVTRIVSRIKPSGGSTIKYESLRLLPLLCLSDPLSGRNQIASEYEWKRNLTHP